jgi:hypothetical protein
MNCLIECGTGGTGTGNESGYVLAGTGNESGIFGLKVCTEGK